MSAPDRHVMANATRCTVHPQHVMVDQGYSAQHCGHVYHCDCGEQRLERTDESKARHGK